MTRSVSLTRTPQKVANQGYSYSLVSVGTQMPSEVFVLRRRTLDPMKETTTDVFDHVANVDEMTALPVGAPLGNEPTFRIATIVLSYQNRSDSDDDWAALQSDVSSLIRALNAAAVSLAPETVILTG